MSTVNRQGNFEEVRPISPYQVADFKLADGTLVNPLNSVALVGGEWLTLDANGVLASRASTIGAVGNEATKPSFPCWLDRGDTSLQARAEKGVPVLWKDAWEFDTRIFNATVVVGSGLAITAFMQPLKVATITIGTRNYSGLVGHGGAGDTAIVVARVTKLPASNGGKLRIRGGTLY
jgi:hypothetical protein